MRLFNFRSVGITFGLAGLISTVATLDGYVPTPGRTIAIHIALLLSHALVNTFGIQLLKVLNNVSIGESKTITCSLRNPIELMADSVIFVCVYFLLLALHSLGVFSLTVAVLAKAPSYQSAKFVFGKFYDGTAASDTDVGWGVRASPAYVAVIGILMAQVSHLGRSYSANIVPRTNTDSRRLVVCLMILFSSPSLGKPLCRVHPLCTYARRD